MTPLATRIQHFGPSVFGEMTSLAIKHEAVNLGQGFPDFAGPDFLKAAAIRAIEADINQYTPGNGLPSLRAAIAEKMERQHGLTVDPAREIIVTHGATEAIFSAIMGLIDPGDEVILFEPFYESYLPPIQFAGGIPRYYTLRAPDWAIDPDELAALFSDKTKLIIINSPHNPTGKVFSLAEMDQIAALCQQHNVIALTDDVYEHIIFDGCQHHLLAQRPGMAERTITVSSLGKTFSVTGWKVGWAIASPELAQAVMRVHQFITFSGAAPLQEGAVAGLLTNEDYYSQVAELYQSNRDFLAEGLRAAGLTPVMPQGTYFMMVDIEQLGFADDWAFCRYLTTEVGVAAIPPSVFYENPVDGSKLARFAFCKTRETLERGVERLLAWRESGRVR